MSGMITGDDVRKLLARTGMKQGELARLTDVSQSTVSRWVKGSLPDAAQQESLRAIIDSAEENPIGNYRQSPTYPVEADLPVFAATEGGKGEMVVSSDPIEMVPRPWYLKNVKEGYAVLVTGESMEPRYAPGEIVVVNPKAALVRGKDVIIHTAREGGDFRAMVKSYMGATAETWKLRQFNPPPGEEMDFAASKKQWPFALRVVGRYDGG
jgi:phage repressor protein C with HTH and peptisase S24 domain